MPRGIRLHGVRSAKQISQAIVVASSRDAHAMTRLFLHATSAEILRSG
jgi:hypothetical protein